MRSIVGSAKATVSIAAGHHGALRREPGYTAPMVVEESRILQVSIFRTLDRNMATVDFSHVLRDVVTVADEVDAQLNEQILRFMEPMVVQSAAAGIVFASSTDGVPFRT